MRGYPIQTGIYSKIVYCVFILTCLKPRHLQSTLGLCNTPICVLRCLFHCSIVFELIVLMPFTAVFCFISPTLAKCFPLRTFFSIQENNKKSH